MINYSDSNTTIDSSTPEPSRRYVQWKDEDIGLLLSDLEQPGHYEKWKENKSGYSKRVGEQIFNNNMNHEAIKFKVRWLESRFKLWNEKLTSTKVKEDETIINNIREKMLKEFPYYDRCKPIFENASLADPSSSALPAGQMDITNTSKYEVRDPKLESLSQVTAESSSPILNTLSSPHSQHYEEQSKTEYTTSKRPSNFDTIAAPTDPSCKRSKISLDTVRSIFEEHTIEYNLNNESMPRDAKLKFLEIELELKKMDHQERMQEMKLEQLRLEIELQKLKRDTSNSIT
ncbi:uncharacterized protein BX663DRAFT_491109 [Cokeromyces recurvatus]|uniref:uncharacterized protein n=1 Tax=Cokeromyces recurvatus TaxID=90255 RepID=UPI00221F4091|nr:uncharacterized protein BX663DRAFT_491109 [Cokeromyces recurvatus]KAI7907497.1 hypothetical protein BX663DRAFT_491109 [Cokeromyces recurvatus]